MNYPKARKRKFVPFEDLILYEDENVIVVNKPRGFTSVPERQDSETPDLLSMGKRLHPELQNCHRLDKMTTGVLVFARNAETYRHISIQFQEREIVKHYLTLIKGRREFTEYVIDAPITVTPAGKVRIDAMNGKEAMTVVDTAEMFRDYTLLDCNPLTGRTHQIRIHLAAIGCPVVGDHLYGGEDVMLSSFKKNYKEDRRGERPLNDGYLLHARGISLLLPGKEEETQFIAPLPDNFEAVLKVLRKYDV